jgi:hypothetical protein
MRLKWRRFSPGSESCLSLLHRVTTTGEEFMAFGLEDELRAVKVPGETAIPAGTYRITFRDFGGFHEAYSTPGHWAYDIHIGMLWLRDVPGFQDILIHAGNRDTDTRGCLLVGDGVSQNLTESGALLQSRAAYRRIYPRIALSLKAGEVVEIEIIDPENVNAR